MGGVGGQGGCIRRIYGKCRTGVLNTIRCHLYRNDVIGVVIKRELLKMGVSNRLRAWLQTLGVATDSGRG